MFAISNFIGIIIVLIILYLLYRKGVIQNIRFPVIKNRFTYDHQKNGRLKLSYGKYNGVSNYPFFLEPGKEVTFNYQVEVEEGSVAFSLKHAKEIVFSKEFHSNEEGELSFTPQSKTAILLITGKHTKGSCHVQLIEVDSVSVSKNEH